MKTRIGFVSNSSSSSFILQKAGLNPYQIKAVLNHIEFNNFLREIGYNELEEAYEDERWSIYENEQTIEGSCHMYNFDMYSFFKIIGIEDVDWSY